MDAQAQSVLNQVARWAEVLSEAERERDVAIRKAAKAGIGQTEIAEAAGLSQRTVSNILKRSPLEGVPSGSLRNALGWDEL